MISAAPGSNPGLLRPPLVQWRTVLEEQELIRRVIDRQSGAEAEFVQRYRGLVLGLARGRLGLSQEAAEELLQSTFATLWDHDHRALKAWKRQGKFSTYLTVIVFHLGRRERHRNHRYQQPLAAEPSIDPSFSAPAAEERVVLHERQRWVRRVLQELSPRDRLLIALRYQDDRPPGDIASLIGLAPGTTRKALHDAVARLRRKLRAAQPELFPASPTSPDEKEVP